MDFDFECIVIIIVIVTVIIPCVNLPIPEKESVAGLNKEAKRFFKHKKSRDGMTLSLDHKSSLSINTSELK